jgi:hypothetical protein
MNDTKLHMEAHKARRLPLGDPRRIQGQDIRLWECDEAQANVAR